MLQFSFLVSRFKSKKSFNILQLIGQKKQQEMKGIKKH